MRCGDAANAERQAVASNAMLATRAIIDIDENRAGSAVEAPRIAIANGSARPPIHLQFFGPGGCRGECGGFPKAIAYRTPTALPVSPLRCDRSDEVARLPDGRLDGRSPGLRLAARPFAFPGATAQWQRLNGELAAYSCGYSHGFKRLTLEPCSLSNPEGVPSRLTIDGAIGASKYDD
jgi:hypothetical protein